MSSTSLHTTASISRPMPLKRKFKPSKESLPTHFEQEKAPLVERVHNRIRSLSLLGRTQKPVAQHRHCQSTDSRLTCQTSSRPLRRAFHTADVDIDVCSERATPRTIIHDAKPVARENNLTLRASFPSLFQTTQLLFKQKSNTDQAAFRSLAVVLFHQVQTVLRAMESMPQDVRGHPEYESALSSTQYAFQIFLSSTEENSTSDNPNGNDRKLKAKISASLDILSMAQKCLERCVDGANTAMSSSDSKRKTVADYIGIVPEDLPFSRSKEDLLQLFQETLRQKSKNTFSRSQELCSPSKRNNNFSINFERMIEVLSRLVQRADELRNTQHNNETNHTKESGSNSAPSQPSMLLSDPTNVDKAHLSPSNLHQATGERMYTIRDSSLYFKDPLNSKSKVKMPVPQGDAYFLKVNEKDQVKAATLSSLVHIITRKEHALHSDEAGTLFTCFRLFSSPDELFGMLVDRYLQEPPEFLTLSQFMVWNDEAARTRANIGLAFELWLQSFWKPSVDNIVARRLLEFVQGQVMSHSMTTERGWKIVEALYQMEAKGKDFRPSHTRRKSDVDAAAQKLEAPAPTKFSYKLPLDLHSFVRDKSGPEEFARQLTLMADNIYLQINAEELVEHWRTNGDKSPSRKGPHTSRMLKLLAIATDYDDCLLHWTMLSILTEPDAKARAIVFMFWVDVAQKLLEMRNYWAFSAIISACNSNVICTLKSTIVLVDVSHREQCRRLEKVLDSKDNYNTYRHLLSRQKLVPTIPLLGLLHRDIIAAHSTKQLPRPDGLISLSRYQITYATIDSMERCKIPYKFTSSITIQDFIGNALEKISQEGSRNVYERAWNINAQLKKECDVDFSDSQKASELFLKGTSSTKINRLSLLWK